jgi:hypothetical protein
MPPPIGTKNLGLIKAIHVGVNPPLNTKILWYNDSTNPYTSGPAKVHYYYDVILADWMPLGAGATINGVYTYIAFATTCEGADFSMNFEPGVHCFWAIITSNTVIAVIDLLPELFEGRWTKFCACGGSEGSGNYTYIAFADDCEGTNFGEEMLYEVDCNACQYADTFLVESGNSSFQVTNTGTGVEIEMINVAPGQQLILNVQMTPAVLLNDLIDYVVKVSTLPSYAGDLEISLGVPSEVLYLAYPTTGVEQPIQNQGSQLIINVPNNGQPLINSTMTIQVGTAECGAKVIEGQCFLCRCYFGIITSPTLIETLTPELFTNKWIKICCDSNNSCDCEGKFDLLEQQIINLNEMLQDQIQIYNTQINNLTIEISNLQSQLVECCEAANLRISNLENLLNETINSFQATLDSLTSETATLDGRVDILESESTSSGIMLKIDSNVRVAAGEEIQKFVDTVYDPDRMADLDYVDTISTGIVDYVNTQVSSLSSGIGDLDTITTDHEARIVVLETP